MCNSVCSSIVRQYPKQKHLWLWDFAYAFSVRKVRDGALVVIELFIYLSAQDNTSKVNDAPRLQNFIQKDIKTIKMVVLISYE